MSSFEKETVRNLPLVTAPRPDKKRAAGWQIAITAIGAVAIVMIFLWGINNQRDETARQKTAATMATPAAPQNANPQQGQHQQQVPETTGQSANDKGDTPQNGQRDQNADRQPTDSNGEPAHPRER